MRGRAFGSCLVGIASALCAACGSDPDASKHAPPILDKVEAGRQPPASNGGRPGSGTAPTVFAVRRFYLGDTDRTGEVNGGAWRGYGFNLDGVLSTKHGENHCGRPAYSPDKSDGIDGIDNGFGAGLLGLLPAVADSPTTSQNDAVAAGEYTLLLTLDNLDTEDNQTEITGSVYSAGSLGQVAAFDGTDIWPILSSSIDSANNVPKASFAGTYVAHDTWVGAIDGTLELALVLNGLRIVLPIGRATITMLLSGTGKEATGTGGVLAGIIPSMLLGPVLREAVGRFTNGDLCPGDPKLDTLDVTPDIVINGGSQDPAVPCDGVSIGIGFTAVAAQLGEVIDDPVVPDPCAQ